MPLADGPERARPCFWPSCPVGLRRVMLVAIYGWCLGGDAAGLVVLGTVELPSGEAPVKVSW